MSDEARLAIRRQTPYFHKFVELQAEMVDRLGFDAAFRFTSVEQEHLATRERAGMYDVYYQGPIDIKGPDAEALLQRVLARDVERRLRDGRVIYSSLCLPSGGMIDDLTCYRLSAEHFWLVPTPARADVVEAWLLEQAENLRAYITNIISGTAYLSVQGPSSRDVLSSLAGTDLATDVLPYFRFVRTLVAGVPTVLSRTGYSGELGYELFYPRDYAEHMWDAVRRGGAEIGLVPCGLGALRSVRLEKKYPLYGLDIDEETTPVEANLSWAVDFDKTDFIGRDALVRHRDEGVDRQLVGVIFPDLRFVPSSGDRVLVDGADVGVITSGDRGYALGGSVAMALLTSNVASEGTDVAVQAGKVQHVGTVTTRPFYDPEGMRPRV